MNETSLNKKPSGDDGSIYDVDDSALVFSEDEFDDEDDDFDFYDVSEGHRETSSHVHKVTKKMKSSMMHSMYG